MFDVHLPEVEAVCGLDDAGLVDVMRDAVNFPPVDCARRLGCAPGLKV
jgi:hypothetical protein